MANKQTDPVARLGDSIVDCISQIAVSQTRNAQYDKTYNSVIIGVDQKFTPDVSDEDTTTLISKYKIPESNTESAVHYYTIKVNGVYYCKKQNGDFKLYEKILVRIPNNDWSNMIIEKTERSEQVSQNKVYIDTDDPPLAYIAKYTRSDDNYSHWFTVSQDKNGSIVVNGVYVKEYSIYTHSYSWKQGVLYTGTNSPALDTSKVTTDNYNLYVWISDYSDYRTPKIYTLEWNGTQKKYVWCPITGENDTDFRNIELSTISKHSKADLIEYYGGILNIDYYPIRYDYTVIPPDGGEGVTFYLYMGTQSPPCEGDILLEVDSTLKKNIVQVKILKSDFVSKTRLMGYDLVWQPYYITDSAVVISDKMPGSYSLGDVWIKTNRHSLNDVYGIDDIFMFDLLDSFVPDAHPKNIWTNYNKDTCRYYFNMDTPYLDSPSLKCIDIECDGNGNITAVLAGNEGDFDVPIYPEYRTNDTIYNTNCYVASVPPDSEGTCWIKVDSLKNKTAQSVYILENGKWVLKYKVNNQSQRQKNMIVYPEEPVVIDETTLNNGDCYVSYNEAYDEIADRIIKSFGGLYIYGEEWNTITNAYHGSALPQTNDIPDDTITYFIGDYYVVHDDDFEAVTVYQYTEISSENNGEEPSCEWVELTPDNLFALPYSPVYHFDYWTKIDNIKSRNLIALYQYISSWVMQFSCGGVGEWMDSAHTAERFNDYRDYDNTENTGGNHSNMKYDHVEGCGNKILAAPHYSDFAQQGWNHAGGCGNKMYRSYYCHIGGYNNTLGLYSDNGYDNYYSFVTGHDNKFTDNGYSYDSLICGWCNTVKGELNCTALFGEKNEIGTSSMRNIINGQFNKILNARNSIVCGYNNTLSGSLYDSLIVGHDNTASQADGLIMCGRGGSVTGGNSVCIAVGYQGGCSFTVTNEGVANARAYNTSGADYAEFFEWADGNPGGDDRCGMLVDLDGDKIVPAHGDDIFGIVSALPSVVGNSYEDHWQGKFKHDVFGRIVHDDSGEAVLSDKYDSTAEYIPRSRRKEWAAVGMTGRLVIVDDGSCKTGGFVCARHGIGSAADNNTGVRVLKRIDQTHVEVVIK